MDQKTTIDLSNIKTSSNSRDNSVLIKPQLSGKIRVKEPNGPLFTNKLIGKIYEDRIEFYNKKNNQVVISIPTLDIIKLRLGNLDLNTTSVLIKTNNKIYELFFDNPSLLMLTGPFVVPFLPIIIPMEIRSEKLAKKWLKILETMVLNSNRDITRENLESIELPSNKPINPSKSNFGKIIVSIFILLGIFLLTLYLIYNQKI